MFKHLLFPSDFSLAADQAFEPALQLAKRLGARLTLLHVSLPLSTTLLRSYRFSDTTALQRIENKILEKAEFQLQLYAQQLVEARLDSDMLVEVGHPGETIVAAAIQRNCDLIVLGSRGLGPVNSALLGSTSAYVLHHSPCPVLIIPKTHQINESNQSSEGERK